MSDELIAEAELGEEARNFKASDLYRFMVGAAEQELMAAHLAFEEVDASKVEEVRKLQLQAKFGRQFKEWLDERIQAGNNALATWEQQQKYES